MSYDMTSSLLASHGKTYSVDDFTIIITQYAMTYLSLDIDGNVIIGSFVDRVNLAAAVSLTSFSRIKKTKGKIQTFIASNDKFRKARREGNSLDTAGSLRSIESIRIRIYR